MTHMNSKTGDDGGGAEKTKWRLPRDKLQRKIEVNNRREKNKRVQQLYEMRLKANPSAKNLVQPPTKEQEEEEKDLSLAEKIMLNKLKRIQGINDQQLSTPIASEDPPPLACTEEEKTTEECMGKNAQQPSTPKISEDPPPLACTEEKKTTEECMNTNDQQLSTSKDPPPLRQTDERMIEIHQHQKLGNRIYNHISDLEHRVDYLLQQLAGNADSVEPYIDPEIWSHFTSEKFQQEIDSFLTANLKT